MLDRKGLTVEVCGEQRLWMAGRGQVKLRQSKGQDSPSCRG